MGELASSASFFERTMKSRLYINERADEEAPNSFVFCFPISVSIVLRGRAVMGQRKHCRAFRQEWLVTPYCIIGDMKLIFIVLF
jgi:hypothetical protein